MEADELLNLLTIEDVIDICEDLGSSFHKEGKNKTVIFDSFCHGSDSHKLWYYHESHSFMCYSCCGSMSLWQLIGLCMGWDVKDDFYKIIRFVADKKGINLHKRTTRIRRVSKQDNTDMEFLHRHLRKRNNYNRFEVHYYDDRVLNNFDELYPLCWKEEGISPEVAEAFDIRYNEYDNQAIIPHRALDGGLIGVRCRCFNEEDVEAGRKYIPLRWNGEWLRYPTGSTMYGLYENQDNIRRCGRVRLFEGEKSVMKNGSYYGQENNIALGLCGTNFTTTQRDLLLKLGVKTVDILLDREYCQQWFEEEYRNTKEYKQMIMYFKKLRKMISLMLNYFTVNVVIDTEGLLDLKDSPIDKGKEVLEQLLSNAWTITDIDEFDELIGDDD